MRRGISGTVVAMRGLAVLVPLLLCACAHRYLLVTAASALTCDVEKLYVEERATDYRVEGCGRWASCERVWWGGYDEWTCKARGRLDDEDHRECREKCVAQHDRCLGPSLAEGDPERAATCERHRAACRAACVAAPPAG